MSTLQTDRFLMFAKNAMNPKVVTKASYAEVVQARRCGMINQTIGLLPIPSVKNAVREKQIPQYQFVKAVQCLGTCMNLVVHFAHYMILARDVVNQNQLPIGSFV